MKKKKYSIWFFSSSESPSVQLVERSFAFECARYRVPTFENRNFSSAICIRTRTLGIPTPLALLIDTRALKIHFLHKQIIVNARTVLKYRWEILKIPPVFVLHFLL